MQSYETVREGGRERERERGRERDRIMRSYEVKEKRKILAVLFYSSSFVLF